MPVGDLQSVLDPILNRIHRLESLEVLNQNFFSQDASGNINITGDLNVTGTITGTMSLGATHLVPGRNINGVLFDGTANITVPAAAGTLTGATLAANVLASSLTSLGILTSLEIVGDQDINGTFEVRDNSDVQYLGFKIAESANDYIPGSVTDNAMIKYSQNLIIGNGTERRAMLLSGGDMYMSADTLGYDNSNLVDFWFDAANRKFHVRKILLAEGNNRVQIFGTQFVFPSPKLNEYDVDNVNIGAGEKLMSLGGFGAIAGGSVPDGYSFSMITLSGDPYYTTISATSRPGLILFETNPESYGVLQKDAMADVGQTAMLSTGNWIFGLDNGSWQPASAKTAELANFTSRINLYKDPGNVTFGFLHAFHRDDPSAGQVGQNLEMNFSIRGTTGGTPGWLNHGRIHVGKINDFLGAANQNSYMRFSIMAAGTLGPILDLLIDRVEPLNMLLLQASSTTRPSMRMPSGTAPTSPTSGDFWYDGTNLKFRDGGTTRTITWV